MVTDRGALSRVTGSRPRRRGSQCVRSRTVIRYRYLGSECQSPKTSAKIQSSHPRQRYPSILLKGWRHAHGIKSSYSVGTYCS
jgi:hypothetical protein